MESISDLTAVPWSGQHRDAAALTAALYPRIRYMGSKYKLLPHLAEAFAQAGGQTALDAFSGSGVVSYLLKRQGFAVTANDMLQFPGVLATAAVANSSAEARRYDLVYLDPPYAPPSDDNCYVKRFHFLEGLSRYGEGDTLMTQTRTKKLPKPVTGYSSKRTITGALRDTFKRFRDSATIVLSYGSNALPDKETIVNLLLEEKRTVEVRAIPHTYHYGTHRGAARRSADECIFIAR